MRRIGDYVIEQAVDAVTLLATHVMLPRRARISLGTDALREACILEALHHPGVPRVYECGFLSPRRPWLAVELVDGALFGRLSVAGVVALIRDVAEVLDHAHRRGIVHGDLRPETIVKAAPRRGFPLVILDWGRGAGRTKMDDLHALGEIACAALVGSLSTMPVAQRAPGAPPRLTALIDGLLGRSATASTAARVHAEAARLVDLVDAEGAVDDAEIEAEELVLDDIVAAPVALRWTPPLGTPTPAAGTQLASVRRRGPR